MLYSISAICNVLCGSIKEQVDRVQILDGRRGGNLCILWSRTTCIVVRTKYVGISAGDKIGADDDVDVMFFIKTKKKKGVKRIHLDALLESSVCTIHSIDTAKEDEAP